MTDDGQLGAQVDWKAARSPERALLGGETVRLEPVDAERDAQALFAASHGPDTDVKLWNYLPYGPFANVEAFAVWLETCARSRDPLFFTIIDQRTDRAVGMASYLRIEPNDGVIEIGHIWFAAVLQQTRQATEAIFLLARQVFDVLGYRRLEWKCDALNTRSCHAAERFGFTFEGVFRQHHIVKGRNRDTAWFAMLDRDWPTIRSAFVQWLAPENFDSAGTQRRSLVAIRDGLIG